MFNSLTEQEQKELHPLVVSRWLSGTSDPAQIVLLNEFVNPYIFPLHTHKALLVNLLVCSTTGSGRCKWTKAKGKRTAKQPTVTRVVKETYGYNTRDALDALTILSNEDIMEMAEFLGYQPDDIKLIKKELKTR